MDGNAKLVFAVFRYTSLSQFRRKSGIFCCNSKRCQRKKVAIARATTIVLRGDNLIKAVMLILPRRFVKDFCGWVNRRLEIQIPFIAFVIVM